LGFLEVSAQVEAVGVIVQVEAGASLVVGMQVAWIAFSAPVAYTLAVLVDGALGEHNETVDTEDGVAGLDVDGWGLHEGYRWAGWACRQNHSAWEGAE
jgi:hypothetical protein